MKWLRWIVRGTVLCFIMGALAGADDGQRVIDATTLDGKILCGYQGWFNTPGDGSGFGYRHWSRDGQKVTSATMTVEAWPETREYDPADLHRVEGMVRPGGAPAFLYSGFRRGPVLKHFEWMRQYGIDGVFLSRFIVETIGPQNFRHVNEVLSHVREGARREGRVWALMYDVSGKWENMQPTDIINDWKFLCDTMKVREDSRYLHDGGKLVVLMWGFGFKDRFWTPQQAMEVINFFKHDPVYGGVKLIGGVDPYWRTLEGDSRPEREWAEVYRSYDMISPWDAGRYVDLKSMEYVKERVWEKDLAELKPLGIGYMPTVFPGFSWDNLMRKPPGTTNIPRLGGEFYWKQFYYLKTLGVRTIFVGMFDEVDEGTAIYKIENAPPEGAHFITYEGRPSDWYLQLTGMASRMLRGEIATTSTLPRTTPFPIK